MKENEAVAIDPSAGLLIDTLEKRWRAYRGELKRCRKEPSEEGIHDLRVATRRLLALVDMLRAYAPHPRLGKLRSIFKDQLDSLDDLRDTQVMLVEVGESLKHVPELAPFKEYLAKREKRLLRSTIKAVRSFKMASAGKRLDSTRKSLLETGNGLDRQNELRHIVDEAYETILRRYHNIEPAQPATIHRTRVAFKKFRYMVEIVHPLLSNFSDDNFKYMHDYQDLMGDIQDLEVFLASFDDFAAKKPSYNPEPVRQYYHQQHDLAIHAFLEDMHQVTTFWRSSPESPFPWETGQGFKESRPKEAPAGPLPEQEKDSKREGAEAAQEVQK